MPDLTRSVGKYALAVVLLFSAPATFALSAQSLMQHVSRALRELAADRYSNANMEINKALALKPDDAQLLLIRATVKIEMKDLKGAIDDCNRSLSLNPKLAGAYSRRGYCYCKSGQYDQGIVDLEKALKLKRLDFLSWNSYVDYDNLDKAYRHKKIGAANAAALAKAEAIAGGVKADLLRDKFDLAAAQRMIEKVLQAAPDDLGSRYLRGVIYLNNNEYNKAIQDFDFCLSVDPQFGGSYYLRAEAESRLNEDDKAIVDYSKIIALNPLIVTACNTAETGRSKGEGDTFDDNPVKVSDILVLRSQLYVKTHHPDKAFADLNKAIALDPDDIDALLSRAGLYSRSGQADKALQDCDLAISRQPKNWHCYEVRVNVREKAGQLAKAIEDCNQIISLFKDQGECRLLRARIFQRMKDYGRAVEDYSFFLARTPDDDEVLASRGDCYASIGQYDKAVADFSHALELEPTKQSYLYAHRAEAYSKSGHADLAAQDRAKAAKFLQRLRK